MRHISFMGFTKPFSKQTIRFNAKWRQLNHLRAHRIKKKSSLKKLIVGCWSYKICQIEIVNHQIILMSGVGMSKNFYSYLFCSFLFVKTPKKKTGKKTINIRMNIWFRVKQANDLVKSDAKMIWKWIAPSVKV